MHSGRNFNISSAAAAELGRQASFAESPGEMYLDLVEDSRGDGWWHIRLTPGQNHGVPLARTDGVTLYAPADQVPLLLGLSLNYYGDLSGGGFLISSPEGAEGCACGAGFRFLINKKQEGS